MKMILLSVTALLMTCCLASAGRVHGNGLTKGYHGFVEYTLCGSDFDTRSEILTSHGYQFSPYFYLGGGAGVITSPFGFLAQSGIDFTGAPIFVLLRTDFLNRRASPFLKQNME